MEEDDTVKIKHYVNAELAARLESVLIFFKLQYVKSGVFTHIFPQQILRNPGFKASPVASAFLLSLIFAPPPPWVSLPLADKLSVGGGLPHHLSHWPPSSPLAQLCLYISSYLFLMSLHKSSNPCRFWCSVNALNTTEIRHFISKAELTATIRSKMSASTSLLISIFSICTGTGTCCTVNKT